MGRNPGGHVPTSWRSRGLGPALWYWKGRWPRSLDPRRQWSHPLDPGGSGPRVWNPGDPKSASRRSEELGPALWYSGRRACELDPEREAEDLLSGTQEAVLQPPDLGGLLTRPLEALGPCAHTLKIGSAWTCQAPWPPSRLWTRPPETRRQKPLPWDLGGVGPGLLNPGDNGPHPETGETQARRPYSRLLEIRRAWSPPPFASQEGHSLAQGTWEVLAPALGPGSRRPTLWRPGGHILDSWKHQKA